MAGNISVAEKSKVSHFELCDQGSKRSDSFECRFFGLLFGPIKNVFLFIGGLLKARLRRHRYQQGKFLNNYFTS